LITNFSPFLALSGGLVTPAGLGASFSDAGVAAERIPRLPKKVIKMAKRMRRNLLNIGFVVPPKIEL
jgi:hypothetical protein